MQDINYHIITLGWFNDNFRREFSEIAAPLFRCCGMTQRESLVSSKSSKAQLDENNTYNDGHNDLIVPGKTDALYDPRHDLLSSRSTSKNIPMTTLIEINCEGTIPHVVME